MVKVVVHCSASGFGNAALVAKWHLERGWSGIGYHYVILNGWLASGVYNRRFNGHIETGRPLDDDPVVAGHETGAHVRSFNRGSVGVCLIGNSGSFTQRQRIALIQCLFELEEQFGQIDVCQHSDLDPKKPLCSGLVTDDIRNNLALYRERIERYQRLPKDVA
ncbi:N-acetylmuramoyl-L-alanine amidase [Reinekea blandensis]|uniref:Possible N-acetylmuramoyl-L-alanine amidase n=1 Tax=Reinekea blandensis MED297 TaxID=314283 RepID=A4B8U7_9GAMM|nr:N-acetylmuramoyl-L-alanine amidase [Reinekea blandensis]EAR11048.1 possible N-acetylmuramoyl-L-alanine amidase [Reinekea sp. MED297] [Reinekea blandensis MED297]